MPAASIADPAFLEQYAATRRFSAGWPGAFRVVPDGSAVLFLRSQPRSFVQDLYEFDAATGQERRLLTAEQILQGAEEHLSPEEKARRERMRVSARGIASYQVSKDGTRILVPLSGRLFVIERATGVVTELEGEAGYPIDPRMSPDGRFVSCVRDGDVYLSEIASRSERRLTTGATTTVSHGTAEFVAQEEMDRREGYWWSPDSTRLVVQATDTMGMESMHIMDAMHPERPPQSWAYPRPGKANAFVSLNLISRDGGAETSIHWDAQRYPYLASVHWEDASPLTILVQNREQTEEVLLQVDVDTGSTSPLLVEKDDTWINLDPPMPQWLADGSAFLWTTERDGAPVLELRSHDGSLIRPLTKSTFGLNGFVHLDDEAKTVYVAGGYDPTQTQVYRVPLDGGPGDPERLTTEPGTHSFGFGKGHKVFVHSASTLAGKRSVVIRHVDGRSLGSPRSVAEEPPFVPTLELLTVRAEANTFHSAVVRPRNFESSRRYPVIVSVYGGPSSQTVRAAPLSYLLDQWIADHGFIVVSIDGRGTPSRGRIWERAIKGNVIDVPLADQVAGLQALGRKYPELDLNRVGIYGWSFGGYFAAMAVMRRPDVFDVGVAGAPVCDWLDYDTHYTERYMGMPDQNPDGYKAASVLTYCKDLQRPLLIVHGTADDNVYFMHTLKMSHELFRAGRPHELLALSDFTHMVADPVVTRRLYERIVGFLSSHLNP